MATKNQSASDTADRELVITRVLNAPRELVWKVWTEPEHIAKWWGPDGFTNTIHEMNVTEGGMWRFMMHGPNGTGYPNRLVYDRLVEPELIAYTQGSDAVPDMFKGTVNFENIKGKTQLTMRMVFPTKEERDLVVKEYGAMEGQKQTINHLEEHLSGMQKGQELVITRTFNAPRELVYKAMSEAEALAQWWGPAGFEMSHNKLDFRPGGRFHYGMKAPNGMMMWGLFQYLEMVKPERIVFINSFSDEEGNVTPNTFLPAFPLEVMNIITLKEENGKTLFTLKGGPINATEEQCQVFSGMHAGMQQGFTGTFDQLDTYLQKNK